MKKRVVSMLIVLCMLASVVPVIPITVPAEESASSTGETPAVNRDAFGIVIEGELTAEEAQYKANNPYGTEEWFPLFTVNELYYVEGHENGRYFRSRDYDGDGVDTIIAYIPPAWREHPLQL